MLPVIKWLRYVIYTFKLVFSFILEFPVLNSKGQAVYLKNPTAETILGHDTINEQEMQMNSEFFENRPGLKNPHRYLRIRNAIINMW